MPNYGGAAAISIPFLFLGMLALVLYNWIIRQGDRFAVVTGKAYRQRHMPLGRWKFAAYGLLGLYAGLAVVLPAVVLVWTSVLGYAAPSLASLGNVSFVAYREVMGNALFCPRACKRARCGVLHGAGHHHRRHPARMDHHPLEMVGQPGRRRPFVHVDGIPRSSSHWP